MLRSQRTKRWIITEVKRGVDDRRMKGCVWPHFDQSVFLIIHPQMRCHLLFLLPFLSCCTTIAPPGVNDLLMNTDLSMTKAPCVTGELYHHKMRDEGKIVLITALKQGKKTAEKSEWIWRGFDSKNFNQVKESGQCQGILFLVRNRKLHTLHLPSWKKSLNFLWVCSLMSLLLIRKNCSFTKRTSLLALFLQLSLFVCSEKSSRRIRRRLIAANSPPDPQHTQMVMLTVFSTSARESEWGEKEERRIKWIFVAAELLTWDTLALERYACIVRSTNLHFGSLSHLL